MRNKQTIDQSIRGLFEQYREKFGGDGFADADINQLIKRTISRKRVEFLDKFMDELNLSQEELTNYDKEKEIESSQTGEQLFEGYLADGSPQALQMAEYTINNYRKLWSIEKRTEMAKRINPTFTVCKYEDLVVSEDTAKATERAIKKAEEKRLKKEAKKNEQAS